MPGPLIDAHLVRVAVLRDRTRGRLSRRPKGTESETETLSIPGVKPALASAARPSRTHRVGRAQAARWSPASVTAGSAASRALVPGSMSSSKDPRRHRRTRRSRASHRALDPPDPVARLPRPGADRRGLHRYSSTRPWRHASDAFPAALRRSMARAGLHAPPDYLPSIAKSLLLDVGAPSLRLAPNNLANPAGNCAQV